jgi:hypothetical protein
MHLNLMIENKNHYLRFGALLEFIVDNIIPITTDTKSPDETGTYN